jgi:hypothetical protein
MTRLVTGPEEPEDGVELEAAASHWAFERTIKSLFEALTPVPGCTDRYIIYSEREDVVLVASIDPKRANGAFTMVKVTPDEYKTFDSWKLPGGIAAVLKSYLPSFISDTKKKAHG